jgi:ABC-2 type transport system ATP-binding protein
LGVLSGEQKVALSLKDVRKAYKGIIAVDGLNLEVRKGDCFGLLGPNGAGKTTTMEICEGLTAPDSGDVRVLGMNWGANAGELRQRLGIQLQETQLAEKLSVIETIQLFRSFFRQGPEPDAVIAMVQLEQKRDAQVRVLSGGQKQRLALACALAGNPEFLFLDEPTTGLDPQSRRQLWDLIKQFKRDGRTIMLTTHYMAEAEQLCDRVAIMDRGQVVAAGAPRELTAALGAEHILEFVTGRDAMILDIEPLGRIEGVCGVSSDAGSVRIQVRALHSSLPAVLGELTRQGVSLASLRTHSATLDDVFVAMTGRNFNDE